MCFSATASFASGVVISGIGIATLARVRRRKELLLGLVPLVFGIHQFLEGMVWLGLNGTVSPGIGHGAAVAYIVVAAAVLPALVPWSLWLAEPIPHRRRWLLPLVFLGTGVTAAATWELTEAPVVARIRSHSIEYEYTLNQTWWYSVPYIIATCTPAFLSSYPWLVRFGALIVVGLLITAFFKLQYLTSIWCAEAALISVCVYLHFVRVRALEKAIP